MKTSNKFRGMVWVVMAAMAVWSMPARADDNADMLKKAEDLVHQAWNPGGDPPSNDQQADLLKRAIELAQQAPQRHVHRHRAHAIELMKSALEQVKLGDPSHQVFSLLKDADGELRESIAEST